VSGDLFKFFCADVGGWGKGRCLRGEVGVGLQGKG